MSQTFLVYRNDVPVGPFELEDSILLEETRRFLDDGVLYGYTQLLLFPGKQFVLRTTWVHDFGTKHEPAQLVHEPAKLIPEADALAWLIFEGIRPPDGVFKDSDLIDSIEYSKSERTVATPPQLKIGFRDVNGNWSDDVSSVFDHIFSEPRARSNQSETDPDDPKPRTPNPPPPGRGFATKPEEATANSVEGETRQVDGGGPRFVLKREAELWLICFHDEKGSFKPIDGLVYIAHLLANPGRRFSADEMKRLTAENGSSGAAKFRGVDSQEFIDGQFGAALGTRQPAVDKQTIQACENRLTEVQLLRAAARRNGELEELHKREEEEKEITNYLTNARNIHGGSRPLDDPRRSMFNAVKQAIDRAVKKFTSVNPPLPQLHEHLQDFLDSGNGAFEYRPSQPQPIWQL